MKRFRSILFFALTLPFLSTPCLAQSMEDVVYFKNGAVLHGQVLEQWPGVAIKIQTHNAAVRVYRMRDVARIVKFELPPENADLPAAPPPPMGYEAPHALAGPSRAGKVGFGLLAGGNLATINVPSSEDTLGFGLLPGFVGGCYLDLGLSDVFSIQPELLFTMKGTTYPYIDVPIHLNYVELPLLFQMGFRTGTDMRIDLFAGPSVAFLTAAYLSYAGVNYPANPPEVDSGLTIGAGLEIGRFLIDLRYEGGLVDLGGDETNGAFTLMTGYRL